jgi:uncharacterized membrane protein
VEEWRPWTDRLPDAITRFTGSMTSTFLRLVICGGWIVINSASILPLRDAGDDRHRGGHLSLDFVLTSQNRQARLVECRAGLDLQFSLLVEHEITRLVERLEAVAEHLGVEGDLAPDVDELKQDVAREGAARARRGR